MKWILKEFWRRRCGGWFRYRIDTYGLIIEKQGLFQPVTLRLKRDFKVQGTLVDGPVLTIMEPGTILLNSNFTNTLGITVMSPNSCIR